jgi:hypothetical protein
MVRIHLPPAASHQRTWTSAISPVLATVTAQAVGRPAFWAGAAGLQYLHAYAMLLSTAKLIPAALDLMEQAIARPVM